MKFLRFFRLVLGFLGVLTFSSPVLAEDNEFTLRVATMDLPPYGWKDETGQFRGIIYDMAQEMAVRSGLRFVHKIYPFNRMLKLLKAGKIDILSSQPHQKALDAGNQLAVQFNIDVIAATKKGSRIDRIEDFRGKNLIYHHGASYKQLDGVPEKVDYVKSYEEALTRLYKRDKWSGAVFSEPAYYFFMKNLELSPGDFGKIVTIEQNKEQWMFVRRGLPDDVRENLKSIVEDMNREGVFSQLMTKYGKPE